MHLLVIFVGAFSLKSRLSITLELGSNIYKWKVWEFMLCALHHATVITHLILVNDQINKGKLMVYETECRPLLLR